MVCRLLEFRGVWGLGFVLGLIVSGFSRVACSFVAEVLRPHS